MYTRLIEPIQKQSDTVFRTHYADHDFNARWQLVWNGGTVGLRHGGDCAIWAESVAPRGCRPRGSSLWRMRRDKVNVGKGSAAAFQTIHH